MLPRLLPRLTGLASRAALLAAAAALTLVAGFIPAQAASTPAWRSATCSERLRSAVQGLPCPVWQRLGGRTAGGDPYESNLLAEHWDGSQWTTITPPPSVDNLQWDRR